MRLPQGAALRGPAPCRQPLTAGEMGQEKASERLSGSRCTLPLSHCHSNDGHFDFLPFVGALTYIECVLCTESPLFVAWII